MASKLYATDVILFGGREYRRGDELPDTLEEAVTSDLKDRDLASTTDPGSEGSGSGESGEGKLTGEALEAALVERELSKDGTADEKRQRVSEHDAENPPE